MSKSPSKPTLGAPLSENESLSIRKIENGWIVRKECYGPKGYSSAETFSAAKPKITTAPVSGVKRQAKPAGNSLQAAARVAKRGK